MCLHLVKGRARVKTADKDIECWKMLFAYRHNKGVEYISPYRRTGYKLDDHIVVHESWRKYKNRIKISFLSPESLEERLEVVTMVEGGGLHTFKSEEEALKFCEWWESDRYKSGAPVIVKCIIPKGSKYYEGYFRALGYKNEAPIPSYASKELIVTKEVTMGERAIAKMKAMEKEMNEGEPAF